MRRFNLANPPFTTDDADPDAYRAGMFRMGTSAGAKSTGTTLYDLPPGVALCPYHYELGEEEWLLVLEGTPTLRTPAGEEQLAPLDCVFFPTGPDGAHALRNATDQPVRVLMWSEVKTPAGTVYPDSEKLGLWFGDDVPGSGTYRQSSKVDYYDGER